MSLSPFTAPRGYGWTKFSPADFKRYTEICIRQIRKIRKHQPFDAFAYTGSSGAAFAYILGMHFDISVMYVRKKGEKSHGSKIEANTRSRIRHYLIIDDIVDTGSTLIHIVNTINKYSKNNDKEAPECVGAFLYDSDGTAPFKVEYKEKKYIQCYKYKTNIEKAFKELKELEKENKATETVVRKKRVAKVKEAPPATIQAEVSDKATSIISLSTGCIIMDVVENREIA